MLITGTCVISVTSSSMGGEPLSHCNPCYTIHSHLQCLAYFHGACCGQARSMAGVFQDALYCFVIRIKVDEFTADAA